MFKKSILALCIVSLVLIGLPLSAQAGAIRDILMKSLGSKLFSDKNLSLNNNQSCQSCHHPSAAFADPDNVADPANSPVSDGSITTLFGGRNSPTAAYAAFSPRLHWDGDLYIGGLFWDGRASGLDTALRPDGTDSTGDPLTDQAKGPFLNDKEMAMGSIANVVNAVRSADYAWLFQTVFPGVLYDNTKVGIAYNNIAEAIAAFEKSMVLNKFNSKFDKFVVEQTARGVDVTTFGVKEIPVVIDGEDTVFRKYVGPPKNFKSKYFSYKEADGLALFNSDSEAQLGAIPGVAGKNVGGMCYLCHPVDRHDPDPDHSTMPRNPFSSDGKYPSVFTDFSFDNLGIPKNPLLAGNSTDFGLGDAGRLGELLSVYQTDAEIVDPEVTAATIAANEQGKFKVSSLRNVGNTAPYGHNGFFATLKEIVHFYNTRDTDAGKAEFDLAEVPETVNGSELGKLGLSSQQEDKVVAFLKTLSDK